MIKLCKKYISSYIAVILIFVFLLFIQAQTELALPDYMSKIITNGVQAGGVGSTVLDIASQDTMQTLELFMSDSDKQLIEDSYTLKDKASLTKDILEKYPNINSNVYVLNQHVDKKQLESVLLKPLFIYSSLLQNGHSMGLDTNHISSAMIENSMSQSQINSIVSMTEQKMNTIGESTAQLGAYSTIKEEYAKLGRNMNNMQNNYILKLGLIMLLITLIGSSSAILVGFIGSKIGAGMARKIRSDIFNKIQHFSTNEFNKFTTASLITRTTNDVQQIQTALIMAMRILVYAPILGIGALMNVLHTAKSMAWIIALVLVLVFMVLIFTFAMVLPKFKIIQKLIDRLNLVMRENLSGMLVIRAFGKEKNSEKKFDIANKDMKKINLFVNRVMSTMMPIMMLIMNSVTLLIIWFGSKQIDLGTLEIGEMMAFMQYAMQIIMSFVMISMVMIMLPRASVAANRINEILNIDISIHEPENPQPFDKNLRGVVEFKNVSFTYPGAQVPVLNNISFIAKPGTTTAFIGSTGSGKSTLIQLILRFYDATCGNVIIDGKDVREVSSYDLRDKIGYVPQLGMLFSGTISANIRYGNENASDDEIKEICNIARAEEFINLKEDKYEHVIAQGGTNVSGGQKQRLSIARALAKKPEIYIFDDSFSALDFKTDAQLRKSLNTLCKKDRSTVLIVGQRISSIMHADQIIVLNEGKIVGIGKHQDLMKTCHVYQDIALSQLSKEELNHE